MLLPLLLFSCATAEDLDAPSKDYALAAETSATDVVRTSATAISIAEKLCPKPKYPRNGHWRAKIVGNDWNVYEVVVGHVEEQNGSSIKIDKRNGKPSSPCTIAIPIY